MKTCTQCNTQKDISDFYKDARGKDGIRANCKKCMDESRKKYPQNRDEENYKAWDNKRYQEQRKLDPRFRAMILTNGARARSKKKGIVFDLDLDWVHDKIAKGFCEATGAAFEMETVYLPNGYGQQRAFSPSLDRTDPHKGYTKDNVKVVCWCYNAAKGVGTHEEVVRMARGLLGL